MFVPGFCAASLHLIWICGSEGTGDVKMRRLPRLVRQKMKKDISARRHEERESGVNLINNAELFRGDQPAAAAAYFMCNFTLQYSQAVSTFWYTRARILGRI